MQNAKTEAWLYQGAGNPMRLAEITLPKDIADNQIIVENRVAGINPVDWKFIKSNPLGWQNGYVPGVDGAGIVISVGSKVNQDLIGKSVAYHQSLAQNGSFSTHIVLQAGRVMVIPETMSFELAASLPCPMLTAWQAFSKLPKEQGKHVLLAGIGAVNRIVAQLLHQAGFVIHALSGSISENEAAYLNINRIFRTKEQLTKQSYFAIFDAVSGDSAKSLIPYLKANGHIICIQDRINHPVDPAFTRTISYHEVGLGALHQYGDQQDWLELMANGEQLLDKIIRDEIIIGQPTVFSFEQLPEALTYSEQTKDKTVVKV